MRGSLVAFGVAVALAGWGGPTAHANIVVNGNFGADTIPEYGAVSPPSGWSVIPMGGDAGADSTFPNTANFPINQNDAFVGSAMLFQDLTTVAGASYDISFWVGIDPSNFSLAFDGASLFDATFDGQDMMSGGITGPEASFGSYTEYTATLTATGTSTPLVFSGTVTDGDGPWYLADVSVDPAITTPEPSAVLVLLSALAGITVIRRRAA